MLDGSSEPTGTSTETKHTNLRFVSRPSSKGRVPDSSVLFSVNTHKPVSARTSLGKVSFIVLPSRLKSLSRQSQRHSGRLECNGQPKLMSQLLST